MKTIFGAQWIGLRLIYLALIAAIPLAGVSAVRPSNRSPAAPAIRGLAANRGLNEGWHGGAGSSSQPVPPPLPANLHFSDEALGWLKGTAAARTVFIAILVGLGHSLLAMSGEESLPQVTLKSKYRNTKTSSAQVGDLRFQSPIHVFGLVFCG